MDLIDRWTHSMHACVSVHVYTPMMHHIQCVNSIFCIFVLTSHMQIYTIMSSAKNSTDFI